MKKGTSKKSVWSPDDLQRYPAGANNAVKADRHWQQALAILTNGSERSDSEPSEAACPRMDGLRSHPWDLDWERSSHGSPSQAPLRRYRRQGDLSRQNRFFSRLLTSSAQGSRPLSFWQGPYLPERPFQKRLRLAFEMAFERWLSCDARPGQTVKRAGSRPR
jgi:hypothetical protein